MAKAKEIAALVGPALVAVTLSEAWNYRIFAANPPTVVYLNGAILFVAGLAIIRAHNRWSWHWPVIVTLGGWLLAGLGLGRMFVPGAQSAAPEFVKLGGIAFALAIGCFLTFKAYWPDSHHTQP
jgi:hypothetical protein